MSEDTLLPGRWTSGTLADNIQVGMNTLIHGQFAFQRFYTQLNPGLLIGSHCTMDGAQFSVGPSGRVQIGDYCYFTNAVLLCESELRIGNYVVIGWNTTIADSDFHPIAPALRIEDAIACSPLGKKRSRPLVECRPVIIEDDVWIGPNATILKGVTIGAGSIIEAGTMVTRDVAPRSRVMGNPARMTGEVSDD
jgi:acetyltransferase-like isoleucine patch superfamily enzyme